MRRSQILIAVVIVILAVLAWFIFTDTAISAMLGLKSEKQSVAIPQQTTGTTTISGSSVVVSKGTTTGSIEAFNNDGFTLSLADGSTRDINIFATTTIQSYVNASSTPKEITSDQLSVGDPVQVIGTVDTDGSIDAVIVETGGFALPPPHKK